MAWRVARTLDVLLAEINAIAPNRSKASDGSIGDAAHAGRNSDHNPWVKDGALGIVTARDFTHDPTHGCDAPAVAEFLRQLGKSGDKRVKYVISNRRIAGVIGDWAWRKYTGLNAHEHHVHVSVSPEKRYYDSTAPWGVAKILSRPAVAATPKDRDMQLEDKVKLTAAAAKYLGKREGEEVSLRYLLQWHPDVERLRSELAKRDAAFATQLTAIAKAVTANSPAGVKAAFDAGLEQFRKAIEQIDVDVTVNSDGG